MPSRPCSAPTSTLAGPVEHDLALLALDPQDAAGLLGRPQRVRVAGRGPDPHRALEAARDPLDGERLGAALLGGHRRPLEIGEVVVAAPAEGEHGGEEEDCAAH